MQTDRRAAIEKMVTVFTSLPSREQTDAVMKGLKDWGYEPVEGNFYGREGTDQG